MPIQMGWCYGHNSRLDGLEYHKGNEVVVAVTDFVALVGLQQDIAYGAKGASYASKKAEAFYVKAGTVVEFHAWCLHFAPNKWLIVHKSATGLVKAGAAVGITGTNTVVNPAS